MIEYSGIQVKPIEIDIYEPAPDDPRYVRVARRKTVGEILDELNARFKELRAGKHFDYGWTGPHDFLGDRVKTTDVFPEYRWIACYPVTGDSEGVYMHIDLIDGGRAEHLFLAKTLLGGYTGLNYGFEMCKLAAKLLGA